MRQDVVEVDWLLFPEDARAVEKHLRAHPAVQRADVSPVSGLAVVLYDETRMAIEDIKRIVAECGYHCRGVVVPRYLTKGDQDPSGEYPPDPTPPEGRQAPIHSLHRDVSGQARGIEQNDNHRSNGLHPLPAVHDLAAQSEYHSRPWRH